MNETKTITTFHREYATGEKVDLSLQIEASGIWLRNLANPHDLCFVTVTELHGLATKQREIKRVNSH